MKRTSLIGLLFAVAVCLGAQGTARALEIAGANVVAAYGFHGNVNDSSGNGYNGTVSGTSAYTAGPGGRSAFSFNGTTSIATTTTDNLQLNNHSFSVDAWVNFSDLSGDHAVFGTPSSGGDGGLHLQERVGGGTPAIMMGFYGDDLQPNAPALSTGTWYNVAWTYDAATHTQSIYENGVLEATRTSGGSFSNSGAIASIGADCCGGLMAGAISNLVVFNSALTQFQVQQAAASVPEPSAIVLFGIAAAGLFVAARRRRRA